MSERTIVIDKILVRCRGVDPATAREAMARFPSDLTESLRETIAGRISRGLASGYVDRNVSPDGLCAAMVGAVTRSVAREISSTGHGETIHG